MPQLQFSLCIYRRNRGGKKKKRLSFFLEGLGKQTILNAERHDSIRNRMDCLGAHDPSALHCGSAVS